jgi:formylglycine-generating enzyme required for sulfatase activity
MGVRANPDSIYPARNNSPGKCRDKIQSVQAKMPQLSATRRMVQDKVAVEVQAVCVGLIQSRKEALKAGKAATPAFRMAEIESRKFEVGESDLLKDADHSPRTQAARTVSIDST